MPPLPDILQWITFFGFCFGVFKYFQSRDDRRKDYRKAIVNDFWLQKVILPKCIDPFIGLAQQVLSDLEKLHNKKDRNQLEEKDIKELSSFISLHKGKLINNSSLLGAFKADLEIEFMRSLDDFEDRIQEHLALQLVQKESLNSRDKIVSSFDYAQKSLWLAIASTLSSMIENQEKLIK